MNNSYRYILGSASPRRRELLELLNLPFEVMTSGVEESIPEGMKNADVPQYLAVKKARSLESRLSEHDLLITADTSVILEDRILNKPGDKEEAFNMLKELSGRTHSVITGVSLMNPVFSVEFSECTEVRFSELKDADINYYINHYSPFDKAGGYGIQEWIGLIGVEYVRGCFFNVIGLPVHRLFSELKKLEDIN